MKKFATFCAISASVSSFMFGCLSVYFMIERHDQMLIPFALIGFIGSVVMFANRK